jgi:NAD(P) transhydrogenase subunit alpha
LKIGTPKEVMAGENRVAMTPDSAVQLQKLGYDCAIEAGAGENAGFKDADYKAAGVEVIKTPAALWKASDIVAKVRIPTETELKRLQERSDADHLLQPRRERRGAGAGQVEGCHGHRHGDGAANPARRRWTRCRPWPISRAIAR